MHYSIRKKMLLFILVPVAVIYSGTTAFDIWKTEQWQIDETRQHMTALAQNHAARFDSDLREIAQIALTTATFLETHPQISEAELYAQLRANVGRHSLVYGAAIAFEPYQFETDRKLFSPYVYKSGSDLKQMDIGADGYDYTDPEWTWWHLPKTAGQGIWTDPYFDDGAGNVLMCTFAVPFYRNGGFRGVVTVDLPLAPIREKVLADIDQNTWISIVTQEGQYVYSHQTERIIKTNIQDIIEAEKIDEAEKVTTQILSGTSGSVLLDNQKHGVLQWTFFAPIPSTGWIFIATLSDRVVFQYVEEQLHQNLGILGVSLILIVFCIWFVSKRITDPIEQLSHATGRISEGDLKTSIDVKSGDEVGMLAETMQEMAQKIIAREQALEEERHKQFSQLVEGLGGNYFYYRHDINGVMTFVSSNIESILGYTPDEFKMNYTRFLPDTPLNKSAISYTEGSMRGEQQPMYEIDVLHKAGQVRRLEVFERPVFDSEGQVVSVEGMSRDITDRIAETERLAGLLNSAPDGMVVCNVLGEIVMVNVRTEEMFGYAREELVGQKVEMLIPEYLRGKHPELREEFLEDPHVRDMGSGRELLAQRKDGTIFSTEISLSPFEAEEGVLISAAVRDITERKQAEEALRASRDAAEQAAYEADLANQAKSSFLANMSHEIRTPMNAILGFSEILSGMISEARQKEYLDSIRASGKSLLTLINDILDLSKVEAGKLELENVPVDIRNVFADVARMFAQKVQEKKLEFILEVDPQMPDVLVLDETRLRQILINLIGNAVKFTHEGYVKLRVQCEHMDAETVDLTLDVEDTGIGIPSDEQEAIFSAFTQRAGQSINEYGGTGLGLSITKQLVGAMGGQIVLSSQLDVGSIFRVRLSQVAVGVSDALSAKMKSLFDVDALQFEPARILIADDVKSNRDLIKGYLLPYPFEILEAEDGQQAIDMIRKGQPDLTLMDIKMPVLDGYTAMSRIRNDAELKETILVALTAQAMRETEADIRKVSDGFIQNPVSKMELLSELAQHLKHTVVSQEPKLETDLDAPEHQAEQVLEETLSKLGVLQETLLSYKEQVDELAQTLTINDVEAFAEDMQTLGKDYQYDPVLQWGELLLHQVHTFDMENMAKTLNQYDRLIEGIQDLVSHQPSEYTEDFQDGARLLSDLKDQEPVWQTLSQTLTINDVEDFAEHMQALGQKYRYEMLIKWGEKLASEVSAFDMDGMAETLKEFEGILEQVTTSLSSK